MYKTPEKRREILRDYIRNNPKATYRDIKRDTKLKVERLYKNGMKEVYKNAGVKSPRTLVRFPKEKRRKMIIGYIKKNPSTTLVELQGNLNLKLYHVFDNIKDAFKVAGVKYPREKKELCNINRENVIEYVKENPFVTVKELERKLNTSIYRSFKNFKEVYRLAKIKHLTGHKKRKLRKQKRIIQYIKKNPTATQWEINKDCKTHVQEQFKGGIIEAYKKANVYYPYERRMKYGCSNSKIRERAIKFEEEVINLFKNLGEVKSKVRTKHGIADALVKINGNTFVIEAKDYQSKPISYSEIKQLNKYLDDLNCNKGILICNSKRKDKVYIGNNEITILTKDELLRGHSITRQCGR